MAVDPAPPAWPPVITDADFDASVVIVGPAPITGLPGFVTKVSPYNCAMPAPAAALLAHLNTLPGVSATATMSWPAWDPALSPANPNVEVTEVAAYVFTRPSGTQEIGLAGVILRMYQIMPAKIVDEYVINAYGSGSKQ